MAMALMTSSSGLVVADPGGDSNAGESYVVFGRAPTSAVTRFGGAADQSIYGGAFNDHLNGLEGDDILSGSAGHDLLEGAFGNARDVNDAQVFRLYQTMLAREPDDGGKEFWASQLFDQTLDVVGMAAGFESSTEFQTTYGGLDNAGFVTCCTTTCWAVILTVVVRPTG